MNLTIIGLVVSFILAAAAGPVFIPLLHRLKFGQTVRDDGPKTHLKKNGTPTIGGIIFLIPIIILSVIACIMGRASEVLPLLICTAGFGLVGLTDDLLKVLRHSKDGLRAWQKMGLLFVVSAGYIAYLYFTGSYSSVVYITTPWFSTSIDMGWFYIPFVIFVLLAETNAVNLTDGLDGLCGSCSAIIFLFYTVLSVFFLESEMTGAFSAVCLGAVMGFLIYNLYPAKVFMGDTGSLALGGAIAALALQLKHPFMLLGCGLLFVFEALSVIIQVGYFKITHGKRFFKMAPLHHHFEQLGMKETHVTLMFAMFTLLMSVLTVLCFVKF